MGFDLYFLDSSNAYVSAYDYSLKSFPYLVYNLPHYRSDLQAASFPIMQKLLEPDNDSSFEPAAVLAEVDRLDSLLRAIEWPFINPRAGRVDLTMIQYCPQPLSPPAQLITTWCKFEVIDNQITGCLLSPDPPCSLIAADNRLILVAATDDTLRAASDWREFAHVSAEQFEWQLPVHDGHPAADLPAVPYWRGPAVLLADGQNLLDLPSSFYYDFFGCECIRYQPISLDRVWKDEIARLRDACRDAERQNLRIGSSN